MEWFIEKMVPTDWEQVRKIYCDGVKTGKATFQTQIPDWEEWNAAHLEDCRYVARMNDEVIGWVALSPTSARECYRGVVEVSVYVDERYKNKGVGTALLRKIILSSEDQGIWSLYCSITKENIESIALHKKCGFREIGYREKIARMQDGTWHDTVLMERRSKTVGNF